MARRTDNQEVLDEISGLRKEIAGLRGEREAAREDLDLLRTVASLKEEIEDLRIQKSRLTEEHEREKREVTHMVGLERKRQEFEGEQAKREALVEVREQNLQAAQKLVEEKLDFIQQRMLEEVGYLKDTIIGAILERLPVIKVDALAGSHGGNGHHPADV